MKCANRECAVPLSAANRSLDSSQYCFKCGDFVWAFRPNQSLPNDWFALVPENADNQLPVNGASVDGDQCEGCGLSEYQIVREGKWTWVAVCAGQTWDGARIEGCGARHPIRQKMRCEVMF